MIHVECNRGRLTATPERYSRHWYDLYKLSQSPILESAMEDIQTLDAVLSIKKAFYSNKAYDKCTYGQLKLVPKLDEIVSLKNDYEAMANSGFFFKQPPKFDEIIAELSKLEQAINTKFIVIHFV